ncbi:LIM domain only protein 7-like [Salmo salar]|uniref:LIM domain only protein 7-like n=1 Tax=Salmo salar TaxID=8030 RepID=A0ABM3D6G1_SALSA|nr:LIM domain only protein 7-like [Salmo salar]
MSLVEAERQQILEEMRKRTALLTDNSWIRQRSTSDNKQPNTARANEEVRLSGQPFLFFLSALEPPTPPLLPGFLRPILPPFLPAQHGWSPGGLLQRDPETQPYQAPPLQRVFHPTQHRRGTPPPAKSRPVSQQHDRVLTSRQVCSVCVCPMGRGAAMVIETLNLCFHLACFQCVDCRCRLGGSEVRAQIRISNGKPYCDPCYIRLKSHLATSQ